MSEHPLLRLIQSLSKSEKRHFKLMQPYGGQRKSQYVRLFDRIEKNQKLNEAYLMEPFAENQHAVLKHQLFHKVLDSLVDQYHQGQVYGEVQLLIQKSDVLYQRKLFQAAEQLLKKAAKKAERFELFESLITIYQRLKRLYIFIIGVADRPYHIQRFWELEQKVISQLSNLREMEWLSMQVFDWYYRHHYAKSEEEKEAYFKLVDHPLLQEVGKAESFSAKVIYLNTLGLFNDCIGEKLACVQYRADLIQLYREHPHFINERATQYLAVYNNWLLGLIHLKAYQTAWQALQEAINFPQQLGRVLKGEEKMMWFRLYHSLRLELYIRQGKFQAAVDTIAETKVEMERLGEKLNEVFKFPFYYFFAYSFFALRQYQEALDWLEPLIHKDDLAFRTELFRFARVLHLAVHYELGNHDLLSALCRSTRRYFKKSGSLTALEEVLLNFWRKTPHSDSRKALQQLAKDLDNLSQRMETTTALHHFHYLAWIEGHLKGQGFERSYLSAQQV